MIEAKQIMAVVVSLIIIIVGLLSVGFIYTANQSTTPTYNTYDQTFTVTDNTISQNLNTYLSGLTNIIVYNYNGYNTTAVGAAFVSYSGTTVTVAAGGLT